MQNENSNENENHNYNVLVIDDNEDILLMLKAMLQYHGFHVSIKENAIEVSSFIERLLPDVIVMDMLLSGADGREVCKEIKNNPAIATIPVIMISALPEAGESCMNAGANYFIGKPFEMKEIVQTVSLALADKKNNSLQ